MYVFFDTILFILTNSNKCKLLIFSMKFLNKLADADVLACGSNLLKDRRLWRFVLDPVPANSNEKIGELARYQCRNALLINYF